MRVYQCEDSLEGIFTAIYNIYEDRCNKEEVQVSLTDELMLFAEYVPVVPDPEKTVKVMRTLQRTFGEADYMELCYALSSPEPRKAQAVFHTVRRGLERKTAPGHLLDDLSDDYIHTVFQLKRAAQNEYLHLRGFTRFEELENGILHAVITPKNNVLTFLMPHFADRFPCENFMLYDKGRELFGIHPAGKDWYLVQTPVLQTALSQTEPDGEESFFRVSGNEVHYSALFQHFCQTIAIKERKNLELQRNMLPLRFREHMVEFRTCERN